MFVCANFFVRRKISKMLRPRNDKVNSGGILVVNVLLLFEIYHFMCFNDFSTEV